MQALFSRLELLLDHLPHSAPLNMAIDEALLAGARRPILRIYRWERSAVSFGYFEKAEPILAAHPDREPVRRWTGGGIVLHGEDLTYSLLVPADDAFLTMHTAESYRLVHEQIAEVMGRCGLAASTAPVAAPKISQACFENAAQHDLLDGDRKIAGAAQRRTRSGLLHQGSIQSVALPESFGRDLAKAFSGEIEETALPDDTLQAAADLAARRYAAEAWLRKF